MRYKNKGFTIVEILTVLAVIAILIGALLPALTTARNAARTAKQRVQFVAIDQALLAFRNDNGDYPPFSLDSTSGFDYLGAHQLAEALLGWDLLGFHPKSVWRADGLNIAGNPVYYKGTDPVLLKNNLAQRRPRYLELETANAFHTGKVTGSFDGLFVNYGSMNPYNYVLCDVFGWKTVYVGNTKMNAGLPILYFRADPSKTIFGPNPDPMSRSNIYEVDDNSDLILARANDEVNGMSLNRLTNGKVFYSPSYKIVDQKVTSRPWPHRPDSYILISAGIDGLYGTADDITNFGY
jgi:prepilin-type N-terminal cleavage/methylation domain-containing protein